MTLVDFAKANPNFTALYFFLVVIDFPPNGYGMDQTEQFGPMTTLVKPYCIWLPWNTSV